MIGPPLPPGFVREDDEEISSSTILQESHQKDSSSSSSTESIQGNQNSKRFYGPSKEALQESKRIKLTEEEEDSEDDTIGFVGPPRPSAFQSQLSEERQARLEEHNKELEKIEKANGERKKVPKREEWMLSLPEGRSQLASLGPRTFSKSGAVHKLDKSWTEIPSEKSSETNQESRKSLKKEIEEHHEDKNAEERNKSSNDFFESYNRQRGPSLLELHQKHEQQNKLISSPSSSNSSKVVGYLNPFDREEDLKRRPVDAKKVNKMIEHSKQLHSNFVKGHENYQ